MIKLLIKKGWINKGNYHRFRLLLNFEQYKDFDQK